MARVGNRTKLTEGVIKKIADAIYSGATKELAAKYAQVSVSSLMHWLQIAREESEGIDNGAEPDPEKSRYLELLHAIDDATGELAIELLQEIQTARQNRDVSSSFKMLTFLDKSYNSQQNIDVTSGGEKVEAKVTLSVVYVDKKPVSNDDTGS